MNCELTGKLKLVGNPVNLEIVTVGGESRMINSNQYVISIRDTYSSFVEMEVLGIEEISTNIENIEFSRVLAEFQKKMLQRYLDPLVGKLIY